MKKFSQLSSGDASDSICPKGWGMGGYEGDGSWQKLIANAYGERAIETVQKYQEYNKEIWSDEILLNKLLLFSRAGIYSHSSGNRASRNSAGGFWAMTAYEISRIIYAIDLRLKDSYFSTQYKNLKGYGYSVRCVAKEPKIRDKTFA